MKIDGKASVFAEPDRTSIVIGVSTESKVLEAAQSENTQKMANVISAITGLGVKREDIRTQTYQIQPQYDFANGEQIFRGYMVVHEIKVEAEDIGMAGRIINQAVKAGANMVGSISFYISEPDQYYQMALNMAIENAVAKAESIGRRINTYVNLTPVRIIETTMKNIAPVPYISMQAAGGATPVQPGLVEITAQIEGTFIYSCVSGYK
jgi:hypothetical protein